MPNCINVQNAIPVAVIQKCNPIIDPPPTTPSRGPRSPLLWPFPSKSLGSTRLDSAMRLFIRADLYHHHHQRKWRFPSPTVCVRSLYVVAVDTVESIVPQLHPKTGRPPYNAAHRIESLFFPFFFFIKVFPPPCQLSNLSTSCGNGVLSNPSSSYRHGRCLLQRRFNVQSCNSPLLSFFFPSPLSNQSKFAVSTTS